MKGRQVLVESGSTDGGRSRGQGGFSLVEVLAAIVILSLVGLSILSGVSMVVSAGANQRTTSSLTVATQNYTDAVLSAPYVACASADDYSPEIVGLGPQEKASVTVVVVGYWNGSPMPTMAEPTAAQWAGSFTSKCSDDLGLQRITYRVTSFGGKSAERTVSVLKRSTSPDAEPNPDPPPGGRECVISAPTRVASTWVNEFAGSTNDNYSTGSRSTEMNMLYLAGSRRYSYLRFDVSPNVECANGGKLPAGATILAAQVRLYTFNIGGLPACGADSCWHVMERVRSAWNESKVTWNNQPCPTGYGQSCQADGKPSTILFEHGTGAFNWSARFQQVQNTQLLDDVRSFYASPGTNYGWVIKEACAIPYGKACGSVSPGFQMRSSRATDVSQRPTLTVYY